MEEEPITLRPNTRELEDIQYTSGLAKFKELELQKWLVLKKDCKAYANNKWINNTCRVTSNNCHIDDCFALQLIKHIKGHL